MIYKLLLTIGVILILAKVAVSADFMNLELSCQYDYCIEGKSTDWNLTIHNFGDKTLKIIGYKIINAKNENEILKYETEKPIEIVPPLNYKFSIKQRIPYVDDDSFTVNICLKTQPEQESWGKVGKSIEHCYREINFTFFVIECIENDDCDGRKICISQDCIELNCSACQYPSGHMCKDYECCNTDECNKNEICKNYECVTLECASDEFLINHTCSKAGCKENEGIIDFMCTPLECEDDELIRNQICEKLNCSEDEYAYNHSCAKLNCSYNQLFENHACVNFNCSEDEYFLNHKCERLKCNFLQKAQNHECRINSYIMLQVFILFLIYFFIRLIITKRRYIEKKKIVDKFLETRLKKGENIKSSEKNYDRGMKNG